MVYDSHQSFDYFCIFEDALSIPDWCHLNVVSGFSSTDSIYLYHLLRVICMKRTAPKTFLSNRYLCPFEIVVRQYG